MMKSYYYNLDDAEFFNATGEKIPRCVPELYYQERAVWKIFLRDRDNHKPDFDGIVAWSAAIDRDFSSESAPMCRSCDADISVNDTEGSVTVLIDANTAEFLAAVDGTIGRTAYFELCGLDAEGGRKLCLCFEIRARMAIDPDPAVAPQVHDTMATKVYTALAISGALIDYPTSSGARQIASAAVQSGGYVNSSGARQIASAVVASGGYVNSAAAEEIAAAVVSSAGGQVKSTVEVIDWTSTSAHIPVLSGGTCYTFLQPVSALQIDAVPRSFEDATILCHFSGGTNFLYPPDLGEIGDIEVSSGFYRIAVNAKQLIAAPVSYTGPVGIYSDDGPEGVTSAWVMRNWNISNDYGARIVYNGGAASNVSVTDDGGRGKLQVSGGYVERLYVGESGIVSATGGTISRLTVSAKGTAYIYGAEVQDLVIHNGGATPQVRVSEGGIVRGVRTSGVCEVWLYSGGRAEQIDCAISTFCHVSAGAIVSGGDYSGTRLKLIDGGSAVGLTLAMRASGDANNGVLAGGVLSGCLIAPGGIYIVKGGTAYATTIGEAGARFIVSGGTASAVTISSGGTLTVSSGGTALAVTSNAGAVVVSNAGAVIEYA